jgi:diadenosine tetraphosphatase ApaH/serine/threonine PP2A family protein phosphatase
MMRTIVIGDIHGCLTELQQLVAKLNYQQGVDRLIFAGDLVDRGIDSAGVVQYAMRIGAEAVCGNHDNKLLRRAKHMAKQRNNPAYVNPMKPSEDQENTLSHLGDAELAWLSSLPYHIKLDQFNAVVVHAGVVPGVPLVRQREEALMMIRYIDNDSGKMKPMLMPGYRKPENSAYWADKFDGGFDVIFGHNVVGLENIKVWENNSGGRCYGIDTGCVFGGRLSALVMCDRETPYEVVQVNALKVYNQTIADVD